MADIVTRYEDYLIEIKHASNNTVASYMRDIHQYASYLLELGSDVLDATQQTISEYVHWLQGRGKSPATVSRSLASLKSLYLFAVNEDEIDQNPVHNIKLEKAEKKLPQILSGKEVELLLEQPKCSDMKGYRDKAMLELLYATGIRVSELPAITAEAARRGVAVVRCKGKSRRVLIPTRLQKKLLRYMKQHRIAFGPVFVTRSGAPLDRSNIWREMKALCRAAGVSDKKVFPHNFRHLFARTFYRLNKDLAKLADLLGHSSINTTRIYIRTTSAEHRRCLERMRLVL